MSNTYPKSSEYSDHRSGELYFSTLEPRDNIRLELESAPLKLSSGVYSESKIVMKGLINNRPNGYSEHDTNQDHFINREGVYIVTDGAGGHKGGREASQAAAIGFDTALSSLHPQLIAARNDSKTITSLLRDALSQADQAVADAKQSSRANIEDAGTTLTSAIYLGENRFAFVNVGDSVAFVMNGQANIQQITTEQCQENYLLNALRGDGSRTGVRSPRQPKKNPLTSDEIIIMDIEPDSQILLCSDGLVGDTAEERIHPVLLAEQMKMFSDSPGNAARVLTYLPSDLARNGHPSKIDDTTALVVSITSKPQINDQLHPFGLPGNPSQPVDPMESTPEAKFSFKRLREFGKNALSNVSRPFGKFGEYKSARKNKRTPDSAANVPRGSESTQNRLSRRERLRHFGRGILDHAYNARTFAGRQLDRFDTAMGSSWAQFTAYKAARQPRNFEYKTPSKRKLAAIGGIALAAAGTFAAVKYGFDIPDFNMPDVSVPFGDIVDGAVEDIEDALSGDNSVEGFAVPETTPPSITLQDMVSTPMNSWNGTSGNTGFLSGTVYDQVAQSVTELAHNNKIDFDISQLRQQNPGTFEHDYYTFIDNVLQSNNLTWEQAAQLPAGSTLDIDSDHVQTFFNSQNIKLPPIESPPVSAPQETNVHPGVIASVAAAGVAAVLGGWLAARRKKRQNSASA